MFGNLQLFHEIKVSVKPGNTLELPKVFCVCSTISIVLRASIDLVNLVEGPLFMIKVLSQSGCFSLSQEC